MEDIEIKKTASLSEEHFNRTADIYYEAWLDVLKNEFTRRTDEAIRDIVRAQFRSRSLMFPEGQLSAYHHGLNKVIGNISSLRVDDIYLFKSWNILTSSGYFYTHNNNGKHIVCPAVNTDREIHKLGIRGVAKRLVLSARDVTVSLKEQGLEKMFVYTRPSGYGPYVKKYGDTPIEKYFDNKMDGHKEFPDAIDLHLGLGAKIIKPVENARPADKSSLGYCVIMEYEI